MFRFDVLSDYWPLFIEGAEMTVKLTLACVICGVFLGMILGMARMAQARHQLSRHCCTSVSGGP